MATSMDLGKQVGPLPLGAWLVVVAGGLGIAYYTRQHGSSEPTTVDDTSSPAGVGDGTVGGWTTTQPTTSSPTSAVPTPPTTNEEWAYRATQYLISIGTPSTTAQSATSKYIAEQQLSVTEYSMIALALIAIGPLPVPLSNAGGTVPTTPTKTPAKVAPKNLKATSVSSTNIVLDWDPIPGAKGYTIYVNGKQNGNSVLYSTGSARYLKGKTTYAIGVAGVFSNGTGPTATISVKTK